MREVSSVRCLFEGPESKVLLPDGIGGISGITATKSATSSIHRRKLVIKGS